MRETDVAIIGAGSTGLLLAQGLKAAGISFRIFERHSEGHLSREWSMSLHWGGEFLNKVLPPSLRARLNEIDTDPEHDFSNENGFVQCNGDSGEVIMVMPGTMPRRVSRRRLRSLLSEGLDIEVWPVYLTSLASREVNCTPPKYNKALESFSPNDPQCASRYAKVTFSDSSTLACRIIVGCDGSRSRVRQILISNDALSSPSLTPYTILNFPCAYDARISSELRAIHPVFKVSYHPKLNCVYMLSVLDTTQSTAIGTTTFQNLLSWRGVPSASDVKADPSVALQRLRELGCQFAPPFCVAAANVNADTPLFVDQGMQWDPRPHFTASDLEPSTGSERTTSWNGHCYAGTATLAGDAAHAMLPHRGQGLNHALEDAARLVDALSAVFRERTKILQDAIAMYETEMVQRGGQEVEITAKAAEAAHDWSKLTRSPVFRYGANKTR